MRAETIAKVARLYPFLSGCGTFANRPFLDMFAGRPKGDAWADVEGGKLSVSLDDYVGRAAFFVGDLDRKISAIIDRFVRSGDTVLDIGANIGLVALRLPSVSDPREQSTPSSRTRPLPTGSGLPWTTTASPTSSFTK